MLILFFLLEIFFSYYSNINLDQLRKPCHKFTHILQLSQSCEQENLNSSNKFLHLIGPIIEQRNFINNTQVLFGRFHDFLQQLLQKSYQVTYIERLWFLCIIIFLLYFTSLLFLYHSICSTLFFSNHLLQVSQSHSSVIHSDLKNYNVFCKRIKCKINLYNMANVHYNYFGKITSKNWLKLFVSITFKNFFFNFIFAVSFYRAYVHLCFNFRGKNLSFWP